MYLGIDIGGTKTLVATLDNNGIILERHKFPTPKSYDEFKTTLADTVANMSTEDLIACGVGAPGRIDHERGIGIAMGNLAWLDVPLKQDIERLLKCPVAVHNDAKLGGLSEAMLVKNKYNSVLYVTVGTGIGTGIIIDQVIEPAFADAEGGLMPVEHQGKIVKWESLASGHAIYEHFGKKAEDITDEAAWRYIAHNLAVGLIDLIAVIQPEVIILGGGVASYYDRLAAPLQAALQEYETPLIPIPPLQKAARPEEAVVYGCYDLAKSLYGKARS